MTGLALPKPEKRAKAPRKPIARSSQRIRTRRPLGTKRRETKAAGDLTNVEWGLILAAYFCRCAYCGVREATQVDHIRPISKGGRHTANNVAPACSRCNYRKGSSLGWESRLRPGHPYRLEAR